MASSVASMVCRMPCTDASLKLLRRYRYSIDKVSLRCTAKSMGTLVTPTPLDSPKPTSASDDSRMLSSIG
ncbi:hypothetical protein D3C80_2230390 [compost metagenome]